LSASSFCTQVRTHGVSSRKADLHINFMRPAHTVYVISLYFMVQLAAFWQVQVLLHLWDMLGTSYTDYWKLF